jgi:hypothetical protein
MVAFFKWLWRVNAMLVFVALVAVIVFLLPSSKARITQPLLDYVGPPPSVVTVKLKPTYTYELEKDLLIGADTSRADFEIYRLVRWGKIEGKPVTPEAAATVNLLVADKKTGSNKWLFPGFDRAIVNQETVLTGRWYWHEPEIDDDIPVEIVVLKVIDADTNGDGAFTLDDRQTLYVARFPATAPEKLLTADAIWFTMQNKKEYQIGYRDKGEGFLAVYALPDFTLVSKTKVEGLPN